MKKRTKITTIETNLVGRTLWFANEPITPPGIAHLAGSSVEVVAVYQDAESALRLVVADCVDGALHTIDMGAWLYLDQRRSSEGK